MKRRLALSACTALAALVVAPASSTPGLPWSMGSLGGADSAGVNSWSTGPNTAVRSHRLRLEKETAPIPLRAFSFASSSFRTVADLNRQVRQAIARPVRYLTVDVGIGDVCAHTPLAEFRSRLASALAALSRSRVVRRPGESSNQREILVLSIENLAEHWRVLGGKSDLGCGLEPGLRLTEIQRRTSALNDIVARVCYRTTGCLFDAGARYRMPLRASYFSAGDPRRLSVEGERAVAAVEWRAATALLSAMS